MSDEDFLLIGLALLAWSKWMESSPAQALQRGGSKLYDVLHDDAGHKRDLPGRQWKMQAIESIAFRAGFPDPHLAAAIAMAESGGVENAITRSSREESIGLWQINIRAHPKYTRQQLADPLQNVKAAFEISKGGTDWRPWSVWWQDASKRIGPGLGRYRNFL